MLPYFRLAALLATVFAHPVFIYHGLALVSPAPPSRKRRCLMVLAMVVSFMIGVLFGYVVILPLVINVLVNWNPLGINVMWQFSEYIGTVSMLLVCLGLACEIPVLLRGLVWLGILRSHRPASQSQG